jgi:hypothetical protein
MQNPDSMSRMPPGSLSQEQTVPCEPAEGATTVQSLSQVSELEVSLQLQCTNLKVVPTSMSMSMSMMMMMIMMMMIMMLMTL